MALSYGANVSQPKLLEVFRRAGVVVSSGWLAGLLSGDPGGLAAEAYVADPSQLVRTEDRILGLQLSNRAADDQG